MRAGRGDHDLDRGGLPHVLDRFRDLDGGAGEASRVEERAAGREHEDQEKSEQIPHAVIISESLPIRRRLDPSTVRL